MNPDFDNLLQKIFRATKLEEADVLSMEQLTGQYPYFAPLQYLLAKKYRQLHYPEYKSQITRTAIFFSNPHWLNDLLLSDQEAHLKDDIENTGEQHVVEESRISHDFESPLPVAQTGETQPLSVQAPVGPEEDILAQPVQKGAPPDALLQGEDMVSADDDAMLPELSVQLDETVYLEPNSEVPVNESAFQYNGEKMLPESPAEEAQLSATQQEFPVQEIIPAELQEDIYSNIPGSFPEHTAEQELVQDAEPLPERTLPLQLIKPGSLLQPDAGNLPLIPIEPLYAVDYFASQGIKLANEEGKDKLSQKLRSFTEWLKTMKRIYPEKLEQEMDSRNSTVIQHIAEHSNELEDVVTEAMAEVYARQGLRNKAAEVYQKLSLLNPNKRTYFAARISKLNET
ncbi:hypothetical protein [Agriterribacter sp.]|uniref:hypothetical protein n=1 Tax=Agriterribacter sp. TaxID=2821509 RepID=UPI002BB7578D|nr:hypothetical protein [Agriterribacter sp.]HTN05762.1 hypothetical protein [Agriterribacter sp.]